MNRALIGLLLWGLAALNFVTAFSLALGSHLLAVVYFVFTVIFLDFLGTLLWFIRKPESRTALSTTALNFQFFAVVVVGAPLFFNVRVLDNPNASVFVAVAVLLLGGIFDAIYAYRVTRAVTEDFNAFREEVRAFRRARTQPVDDEYIEIDWEEVQDEIQEELRREREDAS